MTYDASKFTHEEDIQLSDTTLKLIDEANKVYNDNFKGNIWYGRCIFLSWYCGRGTCKFCYRSMPNHQKRHGPTSKRSMESVLVEAFLCKKFHWRIEFLTGGYDIMPFDELIEYMKNISIVYGEKIWLNLGVIEKENIEKALPYIKGICSSIETPTPELHDELCPDKPIAPYEEMYDYLPKELKRSAALIVGLGDKKEDIKYWYNFIEKHKLDRITVYALKPIRGGVIEKGPSHDLYLSWIAKLRIRFPKLEIIGGTNLRRSEETGWMIKAGANAVTKYPATKQFGTKKSHILKEIIEKQGRTFVSNITDFPEDYSKWSSEIDAFPFDDELKDKIKKLLESYLDNFKNPKDSDPEYRD